MKYPNKKGFASDNNAGVHPLILQAISDANYGHCLSYGSDPYTQELKTIFEKKFGKETDVHLVYNGTGANVLALSAFSRSYNAIFCTHLAHLHVDECGAPEKFTGCKLIDIYAPDGKLKPSDILPHLHVLGVQHHVQPSLISITQPTEVGTLYTPEEIQALSALAKEYKMHLHMDGARISNAAAALGMEIKDFTLNCGVDILSFGATKNGLMFGEAVVFADKKMAQSFPFLRKQGMQLHSKMRFVSAQFLAFFKDDLYLKLGAHANQMAHKLASQLKDIPQFTITQKVEANGVFVEIPKDIIAELQKEFFFYVWDEGRSEVRFMCAFDTTEEDVNRFIKSIKSCLRKAGYQL